MPSASSSSSSGSGSSSGAGASVGHSSPGHPSMSQLPPPPPSSSIEDGQAPPPEAIPFLKAVLRSSAFLQGLKDEELHVSGKDLTDLISRARAVRFPPGATLIEQGSKVAPLGHNQPLYVIQSGRGGVYVRGKGKEAAKGSKDGVRVGSVTPGEIVGDMALYADTPPSVSVRAEASPALPAAAPAAAAAPSAAGAPAPAPASSPSTSAPEGVLAWQIDKAAFDDWISHRPAVARSLAQRTWLWRSLEKNYLFRGLDDDCQKERLLSKFEHSTAGFMQPVVQFGEQGDRFYVVEQGVCSVEVPQISAGMGTATPVVPAPPSAHPTPSPLATAAPAVAAATAQPTTPKKSLLERLHLSRPSSPSTAATASAAPLPGHPTSAPPLLMSPQEGDEEDVGASSKTGHAGRVHLYPAHDAAPHAPNHPASVLDDATAAKLQAAQQLNLSTSTASAVGIAAKMASGKAWAGHNPLLPHVPMVTVATKEPGDSFGEIALLYNVPRCATVRCTAREGCELWSVDARSFLHCASKGSLYLKHIFFQHASVRDRSGELLMSQSDFFKAVKDTKWGGGANGDGDANGAAGKGRSKGDSRRAENRLNESSLKLMFHLADQSGDNLISFSEFVLLYGLLQAPFTKFQMAFRMFDQDKNGFISRSEFIQVIQSLSNDSEKRMNALGSDPLVVELFGPEPAPASTTPGAAGAAPLPEKQLTYAEFESLLQRDVLPAFLKQVTQDLHAVKDYWTSVDMALSQSYSEGLMSGSALSAAPASATAGSSISWKSLVAGGVAGAVSRTLVSPLERLKLLFQMQGVPPKYTSVLQGLRLIHKEDGVKGYFRGNLSNVIRITPASAFQFFFYDCFKKLFFGDRKDLHPLERLGAGGMAGMTACLLTYPLDFIRARLTLQGGSNVQYKGIVHGISSVVKESGVRGLYKGLWPSLVGIFPYIGIDFAVYETLRTHLPPSMKNSRGDSSRVALFCCGAVAGMVGQTVAYPLDLVRRRMQVQGFSGTHYNYRGGILATMRQIVTEEGVKGLYRGMIPNYYKVIPAVSVSFMVYEQMRHVLDL